MKTLKLNVILLGLLTAVTLFSSCRKGKDDNYSLIVPGSSVTVANTFQSTNFTNDVELAIEDVFQAPAGSLQATANVGNAVEFSDYLLGLYDIDISENSIKFTVVAQAGDSTYGNLYRVLEPKTFDRYYLTFDKAHLANGFTSNNAAVNLRIDSDKILVVEIGEGYDFKPGQNFTITLN